VKTPDVTIENGVYGLRAVVTSAWSEALASDLHEKNITEMELNYAKGWRGNNVSFLNEFPQLQSLKITDFKIPSVEPIHVLHQLRYLDIITYCKTEIRFSEFPKLECCGLEWRSKATSLFNCLTLTNLFVNRYGGKDANPFGRLTRLESLAILNSSIQNVEGLRGLKNLRSLRLANLKQLKSLAGIEGLTKLEELEIHTCRRIGSIEQIGSLSQLRHLDLNNDGEIASLKPLEKLSGLERVGFYESTNILDGDLSPLMTQKNLSCVAFQNRRHYSHKFEEVSAAFST
jgi:Leucine-rich repeat (LRR) protein